MVDGDITIRDLNRETGWTLPDEEAITIAGLVIHEHADHPSGASVYVSRPALQFSNGPATRLSA